MASCTTRNSISDDTTTTSAICFFQFFPPSCRGRYFWNRYWASDPLFVEFRILQALALVAIGACAASKRPIVHTIGVTVVSTLLSVVVFLIRFRPRGV